MFLVHSYNGILFHSFNDGVVEEYFMTWKICYGILLSENVGYIAAFRVLLHIIRRKFYTCKVKKERWKKAIQ